MTRERSGVLVLVCLIGACGGRSESNGNSGGANGGGTGATQTTLTCISLCEQEKACPDTGTSETVDCNGTCRAFDNLARDGSCTSTWQDYVSCYSRAGACAANPSCDVNALGVCIATYCAEHPTDTDCTSIGT